MSARRRLQTRIAAEIPVPEDGSAFAIADDVIDRVLRCLPLVMEAAREAGLVSREGLGYTWGSPNHDHGVYQLVACRTDPNRPGS